MDIRLQKAIADSGFTSRRKAEELILANKVKVNGVTVNTLGYKVLKTDIITVDDQILTKQDNKYFLLNKPDGYLTVTDDELNRKNIYELFDKEDLDNSLHTIGRLDFHAQGLIIVTNDGDLTKKMTNKNFTIPQTFQIRVKGIVIKQTIRNLRMGFKYLNQKIKPDVLFIVELDKINQTTLLEITLSKGYARAIKKVFTDLGHPVLKLTRTRIDFLTTEGLGRGQYRALKIHEIKKIQNLS